MGVSSFVTAARWLCDLEQKIGFREALVLQQVLSWVEYNAYCDKNFRDGRYWVYNTYQQWQKFFPFMSDKTMRNTFKALEEMGVLVTGNYNRRKRDRTKWYSVDFDVLDRIYPKNRELNFSARNHSERPEKGGTPSKGELENIPHVVTATTWKPSHLVATTEALPDQEQFTYQERRLKDKGVKPVVINARAREAETPPRIVGPEVLSTPDINEPTHRLIKEFGEDRAHEAMAMVTRYVEKWYPRYCEKTHRDTKRSKRAECAANILECMDTFHLRYADINEALSAIFDSVLLGQKCGAGGNEDTDPTIVYATTPRVLGHWLMKTGAVTEDELAGTIYAPRRE